MSTFNYEAFKFKGDTSKKIMDTLVVEAALQININDEAYTVVMRTPDNDMELIRGLLYAEDIYKNDEPIDFKVVEIQDNGFSIINLIIPKEKLGKGYLNKRTLLSVSSCGICGKQKIDDVKVTGAKFSDTSAITPLQLAKLFCMMQENQALFKKTGGSHAAAAFNKKLKLLSVREDIGRHNAVDKVIGTLLNNSTLKQASILLVSGRVSYEIISKAFIAGISTVVSVSACSSLAVDFAKEFGIKLIGFCRDENATYYT
ncbi:formate dehydrogenase accessory sulfurtransferase FdhD [Aureibaculum conchae]|uniref:formate dehydrogenase accessory sulfurtransferase FdhD n=1 Tax=Aureibaculum sp. 2308TA14-22 TaxID=3108392 RepID=UPI003395B72A